MRSDLDDRRIRDLYARASIRGVAATMGCSPSTVRGRLHRMGVRRRPATGARPLGLPAATVRAIGDEYGRGASLAALGVRFGETEGRIRRALEESGTPVRPRGRPAGRTTTGPKIGKVRPLHEQGLRPADIADQLRCAKADVLEVLRAAKLKPNRGRPIPPATELAAAWDESPSVRSLARRWRISETRLRPALDAVGLRDAESGEQAAAASAVSAAPEVDGQAAAQPGPPRRRSTGQQAPRTGEAA